MIINYDDGKVTWGETGTEHYADLDDLIRAYEAKPRKHGHWAYDADGDSYCSNCKSYLSICEFGKAKTWKYKWCPACGAKMDEVEE